MKKSFERAGLMLLTVLLLGLPVSGGATGSVTGRLPAALRFESPAKVGGTPVKVAGAALGQTVFEIGQGRVRVPAGTFVPGEYVALWSAGREAGQAQAAADGSLDVEVAGVGRNSRVTVLRAASPVPAQVLQNLGPGNFSKIWGFSGDPLMFTGDYQGSGYTYSLTVTLTPEDKWTEVPASGIVSFNRLTSYNGKAVGLWEYWRDGTEHVFFQIPRLGTWVDIGSPENGKIGDLFVGPDGCLYATFASNPGGAYRLNPETYAWAKVGPAAGQGSLVVGPNGELYYRVSGWSVKKWDPVGNCYRDIGYPFDGSAQPQIAGGNGYLWVVCNGQVSRYDGHDWTAPEQPSFGPVRQVMPVRDGSAWAVVDVAGQPHLARWAPDGGWELRESLPSGTTGRILGADAEGNLYLSVTWAFAGDVYRLRWAVSPVQEARTPPPAWQLPGPEGDFAQAAVVTPKHPNWTAGPDPEAKWIWDSASASSSAPPGTVLFRRPFSLPAEENLTVSLAVDNSAALWLDGELLGGGGAYNNCSTITVHVGTGDHVLACAAVNGGAGANPAGLLVTAKDGAGNVVFRTGDSGWQTSGYVR